MAKNELMVNETTDLAEVNTIDALTEMLSMESASMPVILMYDQKKAMKLNEVINLAAGENVSISGIINKEVTLQGWGAVKLQYMDEATGEFGDYIRFILVTNEGSFTTTSTFIGRTLKMLYQCNAKEIRVKFTQKSSSVNGEVRNRFMMEIL